VVYRTGRPDERWKSWYVPFGLLDLVLTCLLGPFVWHPTSQSLGIAFAVLCKSPPVSVLTSTNPPTAIQSLQSTTSPSGSRLKEKAWKQHQVLLVAFAFPLFAIGSSAIIYNKYKHHGAHFQSLHAKLGLVTLVWMVRPLPWCDADAS
jgi:hypothetical protein